MQDEDNDSFLVTPCWIYSRVEMVKKVKGLCFSYSLSAAIRDLSIQLLDSIPCENMVQSQSNMKVLVLTSLLISCKMLETTGFSLDQFEANRAEVLAFEPEFLCILQFDIDPLNTPSFILDHLAQHWAMVIELKNIRDILQSAEMLIGKVWLAEESLDFSPVVLAIMAMLFAIGKEVTDTSQKPLLKSFMAFAKSYFNNSLEDVVLLPQQLEGRVAMSESSNLLGNCLSTFERIIKMQDERMPQMPTPTGISDELTNISLLRLDTQQRQKNNPSSSSSSSSSTSLPRKRRRESICQKLPFV